MERGFFGRANVWWVTAVQVSLLLLFAPCCVLAEECSGVLECAEEHVGQEPEVSLSETLCESYQKLGITAEDVPSALRYCKEYHNVYNLAQKLRSPAVEKVYHDVQEFAEKAGISDSLDTIVEKAKEIDPEEVINQISSYTE